MFWESTGEESNRNLHYHLCLKPNAILPRPATRLLCFLVGCFVGFEELALGRRLKLERELRERVYLRERKCAHANKRVF
jgi:hypothetical protein